MCYIWQKYIHFKYLHMFRLQSKISFWTFQWTENRWNSFFASLFRSICIHFPKPNGMEFINFGCMLFLAPLCCRSSALKHSGAHTIWLDQWNRYEAILNVVCNYYCKLSLRSFEVYKIINFMVNINAILTHRPSFILSKEFQLNWLIIISTAWFKHKWRRWGIKWLLLN